MYTLLGRLAALLGFVAVLSTAACGSVAPGQPAGHSAGQLKVVVAFYPFQFVAERVAGDHASVTNLTHPGAEPHDVELTPKQVASLESADLVVYEKSFQAAVDEAVQQNNLAKAFDTATAVPLQGLDPHVWLDPNNLVTIAAVVSDRLSTVDPTHRDDYTTNASRLTSELKSLDGQYRSGLASCPRTAFITQHAAFGYLARRYGLRQVSIGGLSPDAEPSPARIAEVQRQARAFGATTIFYETLVSPAVARSVAGDLGLKTDVLDPVEGITPESKGQDYVAVMKANLTALEAANGCQ